MIGVPQFDRTLGEARYGRRVRVPGGRVIHDAAVLAEVPGYYVTLLCGPELVRWWHHSENQRLSLIKNDDVEVTCAACLRRQLAHEEAPRPSKDE